MALSNEFGEMLLTTGNKSEMATGYATIYGDMAGGYNPVKDLYKTRLFETCRWRNAHHRPWMLGPPGEVDPAPRDREAALGGARARGSATRTRCRPTRCSTRSWRCWWDGDRSVADCVAAGLRPRHRASAVERLVYLRASGSASSRRPARG